MGIPSPVPTTCREKNRVSRAYGSNSWGRNSFDIPMPVSSTTIWYWGVGGPPIWRTVTATLSPALVNLKALDSRLFRIWVMRVASPMTQRSAISQRTVKVLPSRRACGRNESVQACTQAARSKASLFRTTLPCSIRDISRMSFTRSSSCRPE